MALSSIFPCSQSTRIQSKPHRAIVRDTLDPGIICHEPKLGEVPASAFRRTLASCIVDLAILTAALGTLQGLGNLEELVGAAGVDLEVEMYKQLEEMTGI